MTKALFWNCGFRISGHSTKNESDEVGRTLCAAVSSAAYMAANTVTDIIGDSADIKEKDGEMFFEVKNPSDKTVAVINGLKLHLCELSKQYGKRLNVISEV